VIEAILLRDDTVIDKVLIAELPPLRENFLGHLRSPSGYQAVSTDVRNFGAIVNLFS